jgi:hypothetical protein
LATERGREGRGDGRARRGLRGGAESVGQRGEDEERKGEGEADRRGPGVSVAGKKKKERRRGVPAQMMADGPLGRLG